MEGTTIYQALAETELLTEEERFVIRWQQRRALQEGHFWMAMFEAIDYADGDNMTRIVRAYPEAHGVDRYRLEPGWATQLRDKLKDMGVRDWSV